MTNFVGVAGRARRIGLVASILISAPCALALAGDVAPTADGAQALQSALAAYLGASALTVTPEGDHYSVLVDVAKLLAPLADQGVKIDMAPRPINVTQQSEGAWRVSADGYPPFTAHFKDGELSAHYDGYKFAGVFDPTISGFREAEISAEKIGFQLHSAEVDETGQAGPFRATLNGAAAGGGGLDVVVHEDVNDLSFSATSKKGDAGGASPPPVNSRATLLVADIKLANLRARQLLDLWAFLVAHQTRADVAAHQDELKAKLMTLLPVADAIDENFSAQKFVIESAKGPLIVDAVKARFAADHFPSKGGSEFHIALGGISPPPGLAPPGIQPLVPTSIDVGFKVNGYDYGAGAAEAIKDLDFAGEGPIIPEGDRPKITALMMAGPIGVTILPSHILAQQLDFSFEGDLQIVGGRPVGKVTMKARDFDKTMAAVKSAGPLATPQVIAGLTMARGLAKADSDGSLVWVAEYAPDGVMKLNGLPLGKAPQ
ncbi:MAG TPA: hypothetical protein VEK35_01920 [Roseiarcus sp.]|nr:hypothetical protein [Roseiarcus sp.]